MSKFIIHNLAIMAHHWGLWVALAFLTASTAIDPSPIAYFLMGFIFGVTITHQTWVFRITWEPDA